jgi:signal transduction histidine kinase
MNRPFRILVHSQKNMTRLEKMHVFKGAEFDYIKSRPQDEWLTAEYLSKYDLIVMDLDEIVSLPELIAKLVVMSKSRPFLVVDSETAQEKGNAVRTGHESSLRTKLILWKRQRQEVAEQKEPLEIVVQTAATLSHGINNPLMVITALVEILHKEESSLSGEVRDKIGQIGRAAERIRKVTESLTDIESLKYRDTPAGQMIDLESILERSSERLSILSHHENK